MAAKMFTVQAEALENLKDLAAIIANPKAIEEAHKEARKQIALTEEEEKKVAEARQLIKEHAGRLADIEDAHAFLSKREAEVDGRQSLKQKELDEKSAEVLGAELRLKTKDQELTEIEKSLKKTLITQTNLTLSLQEREKNVFSQEKALAERLEALRKATSGI